MVLVVILVLMTAMAGILMTFAYLTDMALLGVAVAIVWMGAFGMIVGFVTASHAAYLSRQNRKYNVELPGEVRHTLSNPLMMAQFGGMLVGMAMAITEKVAIRVLNEAGPVNIPDEYQEMAQGKANEIIEEEIKTFMEEFQRNVDGRDY